MKLDLVDRLDVLLKLTEAPALLVHIDAHHESFREMIRESRDALRALRDAPVGQMWMWATDAEVEPESANDLARMYDLSGQRVRLVVVGENET